MVCCALSSYQSSNPPPQHTQGSIRIPAAWCGCVGLKPTFGLVPYTGIASHEPSLDHVGPMARTVTDAARLLEVGFTKQNTPLVMERSFCVDSKPTPSCPTFTYPQAIAGLDAEGTDPRQPADKARDVPKYSELVTGEVAGLRVGVLKEGLEGCVWLCVWGGWWIDRVVVTSSPATV